MGYRIESQSSVFDFLAQYIRHEHEALQHDCRGLTEHDACRQVHAAQFPRAGTLGLDIAAVDDLPDFLRPSYLTTTYWGIIENNDATDKLREVIGFAGRLPRGVESRKLEPTGHAQARWNAWRRISLADDQGTPQEIRLQKALERGFVHGHLEKNRQLEPVGKEDNSQT